MGVEGKACEEEGASLHPDKKLPASTRANAKVKVLINLGHSINRIELLGKGWERILVCFRSKKLVRRHSCKPNQETEK